MSAEVKEKFCAYGGHSRAGHFTVDDGTGKRVFHISSGTQRWMCGACKRRRELPKAELEQMTREERAERRALSSSTSKEALERKSDG